MIGCSGSVSGPTSASSCYLVEAGETAVLLDLGSGAFGRLLATRAPETLDAVLLSHLHADHVVDLTALDVYLTYSPGGPHPVIPVWGPEGTPARVDQLCGEPSQTRTFAFGAWREAVPVTVGDLQVVPYAVEHPVPAFAMRITGPSESGEGEAVLTFSGDTDSCDGLLAAAADADLLLAEAAFQEGRDDGVRGIHLTGRRAGEAATAARARRLVLTHIPPWTAPGTVKAEAEAVYQGEIDLAEPGRVWAL